MNEEALKVFNMELERENLNGVLECIPNIFVELTPENIKTKNLFLYLLGSIFKLPEEYLDYVKTLFIYDLYVPVKGIPITEAINFLRSITSAILGIVASFLLDRMETAYCMIIIGILFFLLISYCVLVNTRLCYIDLTGIQF